MKLNKPTLLTSILPPIGAYFFFALQFAIPVPVVFNYIEKVLSFFDLSIPRSDNKQLIVASWLFIPYIIIVSLFLFYFDNLYNRVTVKYRIKQFCQDIDNIVRFHESRSINYIVAELLRGDKVHFQKNAQQAVLTMMEFLVTDYRDAFQSMFMRDDIKVAILMESEDLDLEKALITAATTEYLKTAESGTVVREISVQKTDGTIYKRYPGFCGESWLKKLPVSGTKRIFFLPKSKLYAEFKPIDRDRSFLCLPVYEKNSKNGNIYALICIDSGWKYDFLMFEYLRNVIDLHSYPIKELALLYINMLREIDSAGSI